MFESAELRACVVRIASPLRSRNLRCLHVFSAVAALCFGCSSAPVAGVGESCVADGEPLEPSEGRTADYFGYSLAVSGERALVGAPGRDAGHGSVIPFERTTGSWRELEGVPSLTASDGEPADAFGFALAVSGDTAVIGAPGHQVGGNPFQGAAYVFVWTGSSWLQQGAALHAVDGHAADAFGSSVAISGDTIVVGAPAHEVDGKTDQGAAYVFVRSAEQWSQQDEALLSPDGQAGDTFGSWVAVSGDTALATAPVHRVGSNPYQGAGYVFVRRESTWQPQGGELVAADGAAFDQLGPCALAGDTAILGVPFHTVGGKPGQGVALVFARAGEVWSQQGSALVAANGASNDQFATSVALTGDLLLIAAPRHHNGPATYSGAAYVFRQDHAVWSEAEELRVDAGANSELLASSLAVSCDFALLGAPAHGVGQNPQQGAAYAFALSSCGACAESLHAAGGCSYVRSPGLGSTTGRLAALTLSAALLLALGRRHACRPRGRVRPRNTRRANGNGQQCFRF